jgi:putative transposase
MAKKKTMPLNEAIQEVLATTEDNPLRSLLELICQQALKVEISDHLGAEAYERTSDRTGYRNGYKPRTLTTAVGDLNLLEPRTATAPSPQLSSSATREATRPWCSR